MRDGTSTMAAIRGDPVRRGFLLTGLTLLGVVAAHAAHAGGRAGVAWVCYAVAFLAGGVPAARSAVAELAAMRKLDVDLLMVVAALGAASVGQAGDGAILLFLFSLSNTLQDWAMGRTKAAIRALMELSPAGATVVGADGVGRWVALGSLEPGMRIRVRPGERIPADATLEEGYTSVDESGLTGESAPVEKAPGAWLYSGTLNGEGVVVARVERPASESALAKLVRLVERAQAEKSPTERFAERLEGPYTVAVLLSVPVLFGVFHYGVGLDAGSSWYRAMTFLVVASPCAVVISTPAAVLSAMAAGARSGALFKSGAALEALAKVRVVAFDKTGTLTGGRMELVEVSVVEGTEREARALAAGLERHGEHPIAQAIARGWAGPVPEITGVRAERGQGIRGELGGETVWAGTRRMAASRGATVSPEVERRLRAVEERGATPVILGRGERVVAVLGVADTPRPEARAALAALRARGLRLVMLTGDREAVARHVAREVGIDEVHGELLPGDKLEAIAALRREGRVAMVGDGVNDGPALVAADVGIAMGSGADVSLESADVVLMRNDLTRIGGAIALAHRAAATIRFNLTFALGVIAVVGALSLLGRVPLPVGVIAHEGGTIFVVLVGLRLLAHRVEGAAAEAAGERGRAREHERRPEARPALDVGGREAAAG
ncbi:MAG TPA: heavy metal translocating P-type ATPase [Longimicrobiales bacterium]